MDQINKIKSLLKSIELENTKEFQELNEIGFINTMKTGIKQLEEYINANTTVYSSTNPLDIDYKQLECLGNSHSHKDKGLKE